MQFTKMRLTGFKSFVEATELAIAPGMTGVVGPNGCGKSNLVEALRWAMGETSAKKMRGQEMDDVIFGGTSLRPPRGLAEVTLVLDNASRTAPAPFNDFSELEVTRRIDRGAGSDYRINGKPVRARDVQLLFADNATGAHSPALVSQGRVGALINAKPTDRRSLLEEAAGISGLHARRHEAELRLRAAETNLTRLEDVMGTMDGQLQMLRKQARQASRYKGISEHIRKAEAQLLHLKWQVADRQMGEARQGHQDADNAVRNLMLEVTQATTQRTDRAAGLPERRQAEAAAAAALQRLVIAQGQLEAEEKRVAEDLAQFERRLAQIEGDLARERALADDATAALARLDEEAAQLSAAQAEEQTEEEAARALVAESREQVDAEDRALAAATAEVAEEEAKRSALDRMAAEHRQRLGSLRRRLEELSIQQQRLAEEESRLADPAEADAALSEAEQRLEAARAAAEEAERARSAAEQEAGDARVAADRLRQAAREQVSQADAAYTRLKAEADALAELLAVDTQDLFPPLIDAVEVSPGYEQALAAALGDEVTAPLDEAAPRHWKGLPDLDQVAPLPYGAEPLSTHVKGPRVMNRALAHIGLVPDAATGARLAAELKPGQVLVTREGGAWRWDGLTLAAGAPTAAALRLKQRNRLAQLTGEIEAALAVLATAKAGLEEATQHLDEVERQGRDALSLAGAQDKAAREAVREASTATDRAREAKARLMQAMAGLTSRKAGITEAVERTSADAAEAQAKNDESAEALAALPDPQIGRTRIAEMRAAVAAARSLLSERQANLERLGREAAGRRQRLSAIEQESRTWTQRRDGTGGRIAELEARAEEVTEARDTLAKRPGEIADEREVLLERIGNAEAERKQASDILVELEESVGEAEQALKRAESQLADAREARAHAEAAVAAVLQTQNSLRERIAERLDMTPDQLLETTEVDEKHNAQSLENRLERLLHERETMGPVNLRAEQEVVDLEGQIGVMGTEKDDLIAAIARLRQGISSLNKEARERLVAAFEQVDKNFQHLFQKLFGGGRAHLALTEAEDPLEAGLEIYASPPGKKLQVLSLLSGGEQALTALALLFAVFQCTPAPICVLDEVDAPLDEANVGRFCDLVEEMAKSGSARFLIITHHRLTMARMDRLFGVTMAEQGVSTLVSVDLSGAEALRATA